MFKIALILGLMAVIFQYTEATCGVCNTNNGVACISKTKFHPCFGGQPDTSMTLECQNPNEICTKRGPVCMDTTLAVGVQPACGDVSNCGKCQGKDDGVYTCTSRSTFTMCMGEDLSDIRLTCPEHEMCNVAVASEGKFPCVPDCEEDKISFCDLPEAIDAPVTSTTQGTTTVALDTSTTAMTTTTTEASTTTTEASTTTTEESSTTTVASTTTTGETSTTTEDSTTTTDIPTTTTVASTTTTEVSSTTTELEDTTTTVIFSPTPGTTLPPPITTTAVPTTENPTNVLCSQQTAVGRYPYPNDDTCRRYVVCFIKGNVMQANSMNCPADFYFDPSTTLCSATKPAGCV